MKAHEDLLGVSTYPMAPVSHWWSLDRSSRNLLCSTLPPHCLGYFLCVPGALELTLPLVIIFEEDNNASQVMLPPVLIASRPISKVRSHRRLERDCNFNTNYNVKLGRRQFVHWNNYEVSFLSYCVSVKICISKKYVRSFAKGVRWGNEDDFYVWSFWKVHIK